MFEIKVGNKKYGSLYPEFKIYVGRPSPLGNPFAAKNSGLARFQAATNEEAVERYRLFLWRKIKAQDAEILSALLEIAKRAQKERVVLLCWCVDAAGEGCCHARTIKRAVCWLASSRNIQK